MRKVPFPTPGQILLHEFLEPMTISKTELATGTGLTESEVQAILDGDVEISADRDQRLCKFFGTSTEFWRRLQASSDIANRERFK